MKYKILSLEDEPTIQEMIRVSLRDCDVLIVASIKEAQAALTKNKFDALLIDIELPDGDGLHFYTQAVQDAKIKEIPALFLTGRSELPLKLMAFTIGADDFLTKPFDPLELNARITSKVRKREQQVIQKKTRRVGNIEIDFDRQKVSIVGEGADHDLGLTGHEFKILSMLARRLEQVYSREQILAEIWGNTNITDRTVDSHIAHLRQKISKALVLIETVKGLGYRLIAKSEE